MCKNDTICGRNRIFKFKIFKVKENIERIELRWTGLYLMLYDMFQTPQNKIERPMNFRKTSKIH